MSLKLAMALAGALFLAAFSSAGAASAQTISNPAGGFDTGIQAGQETIGETITPPSTTLTGFTFFLSRASATFSVIPEVYQVTIAGGLVTRVGPALYSGAAVSITNAGPDQAYTFNTGSLTLDPTKTYLLMVRQANAGEFGQIDTSIFGNGTYTGGNEAFGSTSDPLSALPNTDVRFSATFTTPTPVPTLSEWAMILLGVGLAGGAATLVYRRKPNAI